MGCFLLWLWWLFLFLLLLVSWFVLSTLISTARSDFYSVIFLMSTGIFSSIL